MSAYIFDYDMANDDTIAIRDDERLYKIVTHNSMDALFIISTPGNVDDDARAGMRSKFGRRGPGMIERLEDVTEAYTMRDYSGPGWYNIGYSDGQKWTNDGPMWIEDYNQLFEELEAAKKHENDYHLVWYEFLSDEA